MRDISCAALTKLQRNRGADTTAVWLQPCPRGQSQHAEKVGNQRAPALGPSPFFSGTFRSTVHTPSTQAGLHMFPSIATCSSGILDHRTVHAWLQHAVAHPAPIHVAQAAHLPPPPHLWNQPNQDHCLGEICSRAGPGLGRRREGR